MQMNHNEKLPNFWFFQYIIRTFSCGAILIEKGANIVIFFQVTVTQQYGIVTNDNILQETCHIIQIS